MNTCPTEKKGAGAGRPTPVPRKPYYSLAIMPTRLRRLVDTCPVCQALPVGFLRASCTWAFMCGSTVTYDGQIDRLLMILSPEDVTQCEWNAQPWRADAILLPNGSEA